MQIHALPPQLLHDLLSAFEQDVRYTAQAHRYADDAELLDYCERSANPIGRLLLHLYGVRDSVSLQQSDAICSALQLINFWQDLSLDIPRGRFYLPHEELAEFGVTSRDLRALRDTTATARLIQRQCDTARLLMQQGVGLVRTLPGRVGWDLRLVIQGGLRILDKIGAAEYAVLQWRPRITKSDALLLLWRGLRM